MYSRNTRRESRFRNTTYTVPPGYDGNRFRRGESGTGELVPDSDFAPREGETLSVGGIPTPAGMRNAAKSETPPEIPASFEEDFGGEDLPAAILPVTEENNGKPKKDGGGIESFFRRLGYNGVSRDDLLLIGLIFLLVTDGEEEGAGELALLLALLFGIR